MIFERSFGHIFTCFLYFFDLKIDSGDSRVSPTDDHFAATRLSLRKRASFSELVYQRKDAVWRLHCNWFFVMNNAEFRKSTNHVRAVFCSWYPQFLGGLELAQHRAPKLFLDAQEWQHLVKWVVLCFITFEFLFVQKFQKYFFSLSFAIIFSQFVGC